MEEPGSVEVAPVSTADRLPGASPELPRSQLTSGQRYPDGSPNENAVYSQLGGYE